MAAKLDEIRLSDEERSELERVASLRKAPYREVQRARLILYAADGASNAETTRRLDMSAKSVGRWRRRFCKERLEGLKDKQRTGRPSRFSPEEVTEVKAVACEPPGEGVPLSRRSAADVHRLVIERGITDGSRSTIVRWLTEDAIRPWLYRSWIFPADPDFAEKAGRVLDLYQGRWASRAASASSTPTNGWALGALAGTINEFERLWNAVAEPFEWNFTRDDLAALIDRLAAHEPELRLAA
jgi:transposase